MALTQISTAGVKNDAVTADKIPANAVGSSELADDAVDTAAIGDDSVTAAKLASNAVVNASVDASAAIAGTKISPDFGSQAISTTDSVTIGDKLIHAGDTDTFLEFGTNIISFDTAGSERARIDSSGQLLIGATSASGKLHVEDSGEVLAYIIGNTSSAGSRLVLQNKNTTANAHTGVLGADAGGQTTAQVLFYSADNDNNEGYLTLETRPSGGVPAERMRITSDGKLSTNGETAPDVSVGGFCLNQGSNNGNILTCKSSTIDHGRTSVDETDTWFSIRKQSGNNGGAYIHGFTDGSSGDPGIHIAGYIDSQGSTHKAIQLTGARKNPNNTGSTAFQSGNPIVRISNDFDTTVASFTPDGLAFFNDTAAANSLGDYEEGTWTPDLTRWTGSAWWSNTWDTAPTTNIGLYRKIGNVVYVTFDIAGFDVGSATDGRYVGMNGLPFACTSTNGNAGHLIVTYSASVFETNDATSFWVSNGGTTTTTVIFGDDNGSHNTYSSGSGKRIRGQGFYFTS